MSIWNKSLLLAALCVALSALALAGENLHLNPRLDYESDSQDGALITGEKMDEGLANGKPNYVFIFEQG